MAPTPGSQDKDGINPPSLPHIPLPLPYADQEEKQPEPTARFIARAPSSPPMPRTGYHVESPFLREATQPVVGTPGVRPLAAPPPFTRPGPARRRWGPVLRASALIAALLLVLLGGLALHRFADFGSAISQQAPFSTQTNYMTSSGRINLLVLGYGGVGHDGAYLTDSMVVMSIVPGDRATTIISVPRDLWVQVPPNSGQYGKINTAYQDGFYNGYNGLPPGRDAGGAEASAKVSNVLGIPITYWLTMDFNGFRELVDALGGIDINVPVAFTAKYPVNDDPSINPNWKIIHFNTGLQHMNGEQAIEYARARYVLTPLSQGSDFARSVRQQQLISAILGRVRQVGSWPSLLDATTALQKAIYSNLSVTDLSLFVQKLDFSHASHIGISTDNVLVNSVSSDGQDILLPENGDWSAISQYVTSNLKN